MHILIQIYAIIAKIINLLIQPIIWLKSIGKHQNVPEIDNPLLIMSATELAQKIRTKELSSDFIVTLYMKKILEINPIINAVSEDRFEHAIREAKEVDAFLKNYKGTLKELEETKPLLGVPMSIKESCTVGGMSQDGRSLSRFGIKAEKDGEAVAKLRASGAIVLVITNTPEFCLGIETDNFICGRTKNPYDTALTCGGSSGGEGALLGAGGSLIGIGSDLAGSIRIPASFNGVFGHKPTSKCVSIRGHFPFSPNDTFQNCLSIGPMARYARDLKLVMKAITKKSELSRLQLDEPVYLAKVRVFYMIEIEELQFSIPVQNEIKSAIQECVTYLKNTQNVNFVEKTKIPLLAEALDIGFSHLFSFQDIPVFKNNENLAMELLKVPLGHTDYTFKLLSFYGFKNIFNILFGNKREEFRQKAQKLKNIFNDKLDENGVLLLPSFPKSAFSHGTGLINFPNIAYLMIFNILELPVTNVPCGLDKNGHPIGIQVVAGKYQDRLCFAVAEALEKRFGGWVCPR